MDLRATERLRLGVGAIRYDENRRRPDASGIDWSQTRLRATLSWLFGSSADRLPIAAGRQAGGSAMSLPRLPFAFGLVVLLGAFGGAALRQDRDEFDHEKHQKLFPGMRRAATPGLLRRAARYSRRRSPAPPATTGRLRRRWTGPHRPPTPRTSASPMRSMCEKSGKKLPADSAVVCTDCHTPSGGAWLTIRRTIPAQCLDCHGSRMAHFSAPDTACGTCHFPLAEATALPKARVAKFEKPESHEDKGFLTSKGHGEPAEKGDRSCAVCHARDFCTQCHVNAPEVKAIQALAPDPRSLALKAELKAPASHKESRLLSQHGGKAKRDPETCATCHTQESCIACHRTRPAVVLALHASGPGRGIGAQIERKKPGYHRWISPTAMPGRPASSPGSCSACHARQECLECHRPNAGATRGYHPAGFLTRHPAAAFSRQTDCSECHNPAAFCTTCHEQAGLTSKRPLQGGYHDANGAFLLNHGPSARRQTGELRDLPHRAGLPVLPLGPDPALQPARPRLRPGTPAQAQPADLLGVPRAEYPGELRRTGGTGGRADGRDGRTGGRADGRTGGRADGRTGGRADGRTGGPHETGSESRGQDSLPFHSDSRVTDSSASPP